MTDIVPLVFLWALSRSNNSSAMRMPVWPSELSPPPPLPPLPTTPAAAQQHPAESPATPLSELLRQQDQLKAARTAASKAVSKAKAKVKAAPGRLLKGILHAPAVGPPEPAQTNVSVAELQSALIRRGAKLTRDGLYGPKTAAAWRTAATKQHLSPMINRAGPKTARVPNHTWDVLSVPAIP